jgi:lysozyme
MVAFVISIIFQAFRTNYAKDNLLETAKSAIPVVNTITGEEEKDNNEEEDDDTPIAINPIIDISGWQLPEDIDYDVLTQYISAAIVRIQGGSGEYEDNGAAHSTGTGIDKSYKKHIQELQKRDVPVAVYAYVRGTSVEEMKEEAKTFFESASPYNPTFYWLDVEERTMSNMDKGVQAFLQELRDLGAKNVGIYVGTYFLEEHGITTDNFDAVWIPAYGTDSGYYEAAPITDLDYDLHQYTSVGYLPGFNEALDLNQIAVTKNTRSTFKKLFGVAPKSSSTSSSSETTTE